MTRPRAGIILIEDGKLALMERHKQGRHYFAFPGGGVDEVRFIVYVAYNYIKLNISSCYCR